MWGDPFYNSEVRGQTHLPCGSKHCSARPLWNNAAALRGNIFTYYIHICVMMRNVQTAYILDLNLLP